MKAKNIIISIVIILILVIGVVLLANKIKNDMSHLKYSYARTVTGEKYGDMLVFALSGDASILNPILLQDNTSGTIVGNIFNGLLKYDKDIKLTGDLAQSWDVSSNGLVITFHLRKDVYWQDKEPFTSKDVEFTYQKLVDPNTKSPYKSSYERVKKFEVLDKYTVRVIYDKPFAPALENWNMGILPEHLLKGKDINTDAFNYNPIGTGPYKFVKWTRGQNVILRAYDSYFNGAPFIDQYLERIIPDQSVQLLELRSGGLDSMELTPDMYKKYSKDEKFTSKFNVYRHTSPAYTYLGFNLKKPIFTDKRVRKAFSYAIDKKLIINGVLSGYGREITGPYLPDSWAYDKSVQGEEYSPEKAKKLLAECGWKTGKDGILEKDGKPFEISLITNEGNEPRKLTSEKILEDLGKVGIKVNMMTIAWSSFINEFVDKRKFDVIVLGWGLGFDPDNYDIFHSSKTGEKEYNFVSYNNPEVDKLLEDGRSTFDMEKRKRIYNKIHAIIADELPYVFLYSPDELVAFDKRIEGIKVEPIGIGYESEKWYVPQDKRKYKNEIQK